MFTKFSSFTLRWGWLGAVLGGLTYLTLTSAIEIYFPDHWAGSPARLLGFSYADYSRLLWLPSLLLLLGLTGVYVAHSSSIGRLGKVGFVIAAIGLGLDMLGYIIEFWLVGYFLVPFLGAFQTGSTGSQIGYGIASFGALFLLIGLLLFGAACLRSTLLRRWQALPLIIGLIYATILPFYFAELLVIHGFVYGLSWALLGAVLKKSQVAGLSTSDS